MRVLYLDLATLAGYAFGTFGGIEAWGTFEMPRKTGLERGRFLNAADRHIGALATRFKPELLAYESPWLNKKRDTINQILKLGGLCNVAEQVADRLGVKCEEATIHDVRNHFLGEGYPKDRERAKIAAKVKCEDLGFRVETDDEAEAIAGLSFILSTKNRSWAVFPSPLFAAEAKARRA